jgi:carbamoyl-phosphate synthase large subunit
VFISTNDRDKQAVVPIARSFIELGFKIVATAGTCQVLQAHGLEIELVLKLHEGRPNVVDVIKNKQIQLIINTPSGEEAQADGRLIRRTALTYKVPIVTTIAGAKATVAAISSLQREPLTVKAIQDYNRDVR